MAQRVKGQETRITFTGPNGTITALDAIQSFEFEIQTEILSEGYLGETSERKDDVFKGVRGRMEVHISSQDYFRFADQVKLRSQRREATNAQFTATCAFSLPNGQRPRAVLTDLFFGPLPVNAGARDEFVQGTVEFECEDVRFFY